MKKLLTLITSLSLCLITSLAIAQAPQKFNYQGIARDVKGNPIGKQTLALKLSVLPTEDATVAEYEETQIVTTNEFGLYTLQIGAGTVVNGEMKTVKWETGNKYIRVAIDPKGGTDYQVVGTSQLLSVPYAIYADKAGVARESSSTTGNTRAGNVSTSAAGTGTINYLTKFTAANTIYNSQLFDNGTNVGLGTTTPAAKFHISAPAIADMRITSNGAGAGDYASMQLFNNAGTSFGFTKLGAGQVGNYTTGIPRPHLALFANRGSMLYNATGNIAFATLIGATNFTRMFVDSATGNVGIGTSTPGAKLHTVGDVYSSGTNYMFLTGSVNPDKMLWSHSPSYPNYGIQYQDASDEMNFLSAGSTVLGIDLNNRNVGVGTDNVSINAYGHGGTNKVLEVNNPNTGSNSQAQLVLSTDATAGGSIGGITWVNKATAAPDKRSAFIGAAFDDLNQDATDLSFWTRESTGGISQKMNISSDGTVRIEGPTASGTGLHSLHLGGNGDFGIDAPGTIDGRFVVKDNGNTGIGIANPLVKLEVNGVIGIRNNSIRFKDPAGTDLGNNIYSSGGMLVLNGGNATNGNGVAINNSGSIFNTIEFTGSNINIAGDPGTDGYVIRSKGNNGFPTWQKPIEHNTTISSISGYTITANNTVLNDMTRTITIPAGQTSTTLVSFNANYLGYGCTGGGCLSFGICEVILNNTTVVSTHNMDLNPGVEGSFAIANLPLTLTAGTHTISFRISNSTGSNIWNIYPKSSVVFALPQ